MKKLILLVLGGLAAVLLLQCSFFGSKRFSEFPVGETFTINFSFPNLAEEEFGDREKADQAKDWLLYTLMTNSGLKTNEIAQSSFDLAPVRYGFNNTLGNFEYGATRSKYLGNGDVVALIPVSDEKERIDNLAHIFDETRKNQGELPGKAYLFEYNLNVEGKFAKLVRLENVDVDDYFTEKMGYHEFVVNSVDDLKTFIDKTDDITYASRTDKGLVFGGRKLQNDAYGKVTVEDIAAIWQSESDIQKNLADRESTQDNLEAEYKAKSDEVIGRYQNLLNDLEFEDGQKFSYLTVKERNEITDYISKLIESTFPREAINDLPILKGFNSSYITDKNLLHLIDNFKADVMALDEKYLKTFAHVNKVMEASRVAYSSGFSLDPHVDFERSISYLNFFRPQFAEALAPQFTIDQLLEQLQNKQGDLMHYAIARLELIYPKLFENVQFTCTYQKARYDGTLQGTAVGMTLFYTDLLAKIWAMNGFHSKPIDFIPDFKDDEQTFLSAPKVFDLESQALPAVRLWFGPDKNGFQVSNYKENLHFSRNATQIFSLSNDPAEQVDSAGQRKVQEQQVSAKFEVALAWWNNRYEEVARYEKEYQRLNEIMKWSTIISWLNAADDAAAKLGFLDSYAVSHDLWFADWVKSNKALKFTAWDKVGLFPKGHLENKTESMPLLASPNGIISGGVSLAERSLIKESPELIAAEKALFRRANMVEDLTGNGTGFKTFRETTINFVERAEAKMVSIDLKAKEGYKLRNYFGEVENKPFQWSLTEEAPGKFSYRSSMGEIPIGKLSAERSGKNSFSVAFESQAVDKGMSVARQCSDNAADVGAFFKNNPEVIRYFAMENGEWCVQLKNAEQWMVLKVHPEDYKGTINLTSGWEARTSGSLYNSRIIEMKWVSEMEATRLGGGRLPAIQTPDKLYDDLVNRVGKIEVDEMARLRQEGIAEVERLAASGEYVKAATQAEKLGRFLGETPELVAGRIRNELKAGLYLLEKNKLATGLRYVNEALTSHPSVLEQGKIMDEINALLGKADIGEFSKQKITALADAYFTDRQLFTWANWQGYGPSARRISLDVVSARPNARILFADNAAFSSIDPSLPFETVMAQIRSIPHVQVYDISAETIGRNTRMYATVEPTISYLGVVNRVRLQVSPGSALNNCPGGENDDKNCDQAYTVRGPVYYITAPAPSMN
ncbi:MAG TPA: hypothetical protein VF008_20760 [Niastella sp.]